MNQDYQHILETLNDRELKVIASRFGLGGVEPMTLEEVGETLNVTRERVRQIEAKALRKMRQRASSLNIVLDDYILH